MTIGKYPLGKRSLPIALLGFIAVLLFLWEKMRLGQARYFDADELAYLHWAHNVFDGRLPYKDFLSYVPPLYYSLLSLLFRVVDGITILSSARLLAFVIFVFLCVGLVLLFAKARNNTYAMYAAVFLAFLPMPADKFIEVRPDNFATLVALFATLMHGIALAEHRNLRFWGTAGVLYGLSFFILPKTVPQIAVAGMVTALWWLFAPHPMKQKTQRVLTFIGGGLLPFGFFVLWILFQLGPRWYDTVAYSLLQLPLEVNRLGIQFPLQPDLFFYPNSVLYGRDGWGISLIVTHVLWLAGIFTAAVRLVTPFIPGGRKEVFRELLLAGSFFAYTIAFMYGYPMRHSQYLIPVAVFIAFYSADFMGLLLSWCDKTFTGRVVGILALTALLYGAVRLTAHTTEAKMRYSNAEDYAVLSYALNSIPNGAYVFDLVGSTIYFRDPFYVSAVPFGQWVPYVSRPFGSVVDALEKTDTRYIYEGRLARLESLSPETTSYVRRTFSPVPGIPGFHYR